MLKTLSPKEEKVIRMLFDLDNKGVLTVSEVAQRFAVTNGRARQILAKALIKLRHPDRSMKLMPWIRAPRKNETSD